MKIQIENLRAQMRGVQLTGYKRDLALDEYYKLLDYVEELEQLTIPTVSGSLRFSEREVDFAYLCGVFNTSGIDGLYTEIQRLKELGKKPHDIIEACRKRKVCPVCKKTFEKGWGEFCSQDCWDTDM